MILLAAPLVQAQNTRLALEQTSLDASNFPVIVAGVSVKDDQNFLIGELTENNFSVYEDGVLQQPIKVEASSRDSGGVSVALIMDVSGSMRDELPDAKNAAITLVDLLSPYDQGALISFDDESVIEQPFTKDFNRLKSAIQALQNGSGTAIYDATIDGVNLLQNQPGKKAIVLLTDGQDGDSDADLDDAVQLVRSTQIPVYAVGLGVRSGRGESELRRIAQASGGIYYEAPSVDELEAIYRSIAYTISRSIYRITYTTTNCATDGTLRNVEITATQNGNSGSDTGSYRAPLATSQLVLQTDTPPAPTRPFTLRIASPRGSDFTRTLSELRFRVRYNTEHLDVQSPYQQNIKAGPVFGTPAAHTLTSVVDDDSGSVTVSIQKNQSLDAPANSNILAEITFLARISLPDSTALRFEIDSIQARNQSNCTLTFEPNVASVLSDGLIVWPGDTDANGRVELSDILVLGRFWQLNGPARPDDGNPLTWRPQLAKKFALRNATHADADGQGQIDERDIIPIGLNWGKSASDTAVPRPKVTHALPEGTFFAAMEPDGQDGSTLLRLHVERTNAAVLAGVVLRLSLPPGAGTISGAASGSLWQNRALFFSKTSDADRHLAIGLMLPAGADMLADDGELLQVRIETSSKLSLNEVMIESAGLIGADGRVNELPAAQVSFAVEGAPPAAFEVDPAYPNPFNPTTMLRYRVQTPVDLRVHIFRVTGERIKAYDLPAQARGTHTLQWNGTADDGRPAGSGTYFVRFLATNQSGEQFRETQKLFLVK